jgi:phage tail-like protein
MPRRDIDPYASFRFVLEIDNIRVGGFSECTGLQMEVKTFDYKEGGRNDSTLKFPEHASYGNITLKRGITLSNALINWQLAVAEGRFAAKPRNGVQFAIILKDEKGSDTKTKRWNLIRAFPVKWTGPDLKSTASENAIESLEIAHEGIQVG